jgi:MerR family copper efflux transcriptional regulator
MGLPRGKVKRQVGHGPRVNVTNADAPVLTIGEAAGRVGLTPKAVRLYEARGLLPPVERTEAGYRLYTEHDLRALRFIRQARAVGLGLKELHTIMALRRAGIPPPEDIIALLQARFGEIERQLSELQSLRHALADVLDTAVSKADRGEAARLCRILDQAPVGP